MLAYLKRKGCRVGGITLGERGMVWFDEGGREHEMPALPVPKERIIDTNGAGDIFHGAYVYSYLRDPSLPWERALPLRARRLDPFDPASRQRGFAADGGGCREGAGGIREGVAKCEVGAR